MWIEDKISTISTLWPFSILAFHKFSNFLSAFYDKCSIISIWLLFQNNFLPFVHFVLSPLLHWYQRISAHSLSKYQNVNFTVECITLIWPASENYKAGRAHCLNSIKMIQILQKMPKISKITKNASEFNRKLHGGLHEFNLIFVVKKHYSLPNQG